MGFLFIRIGLKKQKLSSTGQQPSLVGIRLQLFPFLEREGQGSASEIDFQGMPLNSEQEEASRIATDSVLVAFYNSAILIAT